MKIGPTDNPEIRAGLVKKKQTEFQKDVIVEQKKDSVEISQSGRQKLKELADSYHKEIRDNDEIIEQISPKVARVRNKVESGYYDLDNIESKIADKLADTIINEIKNNKNME